MKARDNKYWLFILTATAISSCTKPYNPSGIKPVTGYLVVEGVIDPGKDSTTIRLSRTVSLSADTTVAPVMGATVVVQGDDNSNHTLTGNGGGVYTSAGLSLDNTRQYRIDIKTIDGREYRSDYVPVKITPPIDTIMPAVVNEGLQINLNAHDGTNNTRYYRWGYSEAWEFHSLYYSTYMSNGDTVIERPIADQIYYCFEGDSSTNIVIGSSAKLAKDVISSQLITIIPPTSEKIEIEYSIKVYQYALTNDAYNFWSELKKNTEQLGSIFDAQPSQLASNIHCITNPDEPVVGYLSASTRQSKRIFVQYASLPQSWKPTYPYPCKLDSAVLQRNSFYFYEDNFFNWLKPGAPAENTYIPVAPIFTPNGTLIGHSGSTGVCVDCTLRGGKLTKPSFWQ